MLSQDGHHDNDNGQEWKVQRQKWVKERSHGYVHKGPSSSGRGVLNVPIGLFVIGGLVGGCVGRSDCPLN